MRSPPWIVDGIHVQLATHLAWRHLSDQDCGYRRTTTNSCLFLWVEARSSYFWPRPCSLAGKQNEFGGGFHTLGFGSEITRYLCNHNQSRSSRSMKAYPKLLLPNYKHFGFEEWPTHKPLPLAMKSHYDSANGTMSICLATCKHSTHMCAHMDVNVPHTVYN